MTKIQEGLAFLAERRVSAEEFRRQFSEMLLMGIVSKGYAAQGAWLSITDAGRRALRDRT